MTSTLQNNVKVLSMYNQYKELLGNAGTGGFNTDGINQIASQLTVAHMLDHVVCLLKNKEEVNGEKNLGKV